MSDEEKRVAGVTMMLWIVFGFLVASIGVYVLIGFLVSDAVNRPAPELVAIAERPFSSPIFLGLAAMSLITSIGTPLLRAKLLPRMAPETSSGEPLGDPSSPPVGGALGKYFTAQIVTWSLADSIAIYGLILSLLSKTVWPVAAFSGLAVINMLRALPSRSDVEAVIRGENRR